MTTLFVFHEVTDGEKWAQAWKKGDGSRHELFGAMAEDGLKADTMRVLTEFAS